MFRRFVLAAALVAVAVTSSCGSSTDTACGPVVRDALDPGSGTHVLPGSPTPDYLVDPPTSGAHMPGPRIEGPASEPIAPQLQVGILEEGRVVIQYAGVSESDRRALERLNSPDVVVAPAHELPGNTKVAATAWVTHQNCTAVDIPTLTAFADAHAGKGPDQH